MSDSGGVWRTISGRKVFIRTGQSLSDAMRESGKFKGGSSAKPSSGKDEKYTQFTSDKDAQEFTEKMAVKLTDDEKEALEEYQVSSTKLNTQLRDGDISPRDYRVRDLDRAIKKSKLKENVLLFRGVDENGANGYGIDLKNLQNNIGKEITDKAYMSTTASRKTLEKFTKGAIIGKDGIGIIIKVPKGTNALSVTSGNRRYGNRESEVILRRNSRLKFTKVISNGGKDYLVAEYVE